MGAQTEHINEDKDKLVLLALLPDGPMSKRCTTIS